MGALRSQWTSLMALLLVLSATAPALAAGAPRVHDNAFFHVAVAAGPSWLLYDAPINTGSRHSGSASEFGFGLELAAGATVSRGLVLGLGAIAHGQSDPDFEDPIVTDAWDDTLNTAGSFGVFSRYYPNPSDGFHVEALAGPAFHSTRQRRTEVEFGLNCVVIFPLCSFEEERVIEARETSQGVGFGAGVGYELWLANHWSFGLAARFFLTQTWSSKGTYSFIAPSLGAGFTLH